MRTVSLAVLALAPLSVLAQSNPVPDITQPLAPPTIAPGSGALTLTVNGADFSSSSVVNLNDIPRTTRFISSTQLAAKVLASDVAKPSAPAVSVLTPSPGGGRSNSVLLEVASPRTGINFNQLFVDDSSVPYYVAVADVNKDTNLDLIVTGSSSNIISVYLGNGDGTFQAPVNYPVGQVPVSVAVGDVNGDGYIDIVSADQNSNQISVLLGNGDGTFQSAVSYAANHQPKFVVLGDFNGDGKLDAAVANYTDSALISVMLGNGDGTFQAPVTYGAGPAGTSIALGDFNQDGHLDLAVTQFAPSGVNIFLGNGDGTFQSPQFNAADVGAQSVTAADFNADGKLDLAVACETASIVDVLLGNGDGTFQAAVSNPTGQEPYTVDTGDVDGNGIPDLVTANNSGRSASILPGNGDGTFQTHQDYPFSTGYPLSLVVTDVNRDGLPDLVVALNTADVAVLLQTTVVLSPPSLNFGNQQVGTSSSPVTVTLMNTSSVNLKVSGVTITGTNAADFSETNNCTGVASGATCTINVTFTPQATGTLSATLNIMDNAPGNPQLVPLTGTGTAPAVTLSPTSLTFPTQLVSTTSAAQTVTLTNSGTATLSIASIAATGDFAATNTCGSSLAPGANCPITVTFTPVTKGPLTGTLSVTDNAPGSPQAVALSGEGTTVKLAPPSLNLGTEPVGTTSAPQKIKLTNEGTAPVMIGGISITGADMSDFAEKGNCKSSVAAGSSCVIMVTFTPTKKGTRVADVSVKDNGGGSPQLVPLTGDGK